MANPSSSSTTAKGTFLVVTLGCAMNEVDSDRMRALLVHDGFSEVDLVDDADVILINTCSFL
ncbi:MAG: 30S ribosomal protein S12 methylthiotransferase RimO, partial [Atopobiaceae bacterium]|nr:30S ribosomal protein S12 methylthiotransferase RimO [Atopobiaceae bacterium]